MQELKIQEILEVLDLPKEKQWKWCIDNLLRWDCDDGWYYGLEPICSLADLAFIMRDEAIKLDSFNWDRAVLKICIKCAPNVLYSCWWDLYTQPIHWVLAALIARILGKTT